MTLAFGGLFNDAVGIITVPDDGTPVIIDLPEQMESDNMTLGTDNITIDISGTYKIDFSTILQSTSGTTGINIGVRVNGVPIPELLLGYVATDEFESLATSAIVALTAGDVLDLVIFSATGGTILLGPAQNATLTAFLLLPSI